MTTQPSRYADPTPVVVALFWACVLALVAGVAFAWYTSAGPGAVFGFLAGLVCYKHQRDGGDVR